MHCTEMCERESLNDDHHRYLAFGVFGALHCIAVDGLIAKIPRKRQTNNLEVYSMYTYISFTNKNA